MSQGSSGIGHTHSTPAPYAVPPGARRTGLVQIGAALGIASNCIGWLIFLLMCAGFAAASSFALLPLIFASVGMILTVLGAVTQKHLATLDTHVLASLFINLMGIVGGLTETAVWLHWTILAH
jgi:hypothetical protein